MPDLNRESALTLLKSYIHNEKLMYHCLASEAVMKAVARHLGQNEELWGLAGLLHDIDAEITDGDMKLHALKGSEILREAGFDAAIFETILMHNEEASGKQRSSTIEHALAASETITGLIYATALIYPDKKISSIKYESVTKRMGQKAFAASVRREVILECEKIGIQLTEFVKISVDAMRSISNQIGL